MVVIVVAAGACEKAQRRARAMAGDDGGGGPRVVPTDARSEPDAHPATIGEPKMPPPAPTVKKRGKGDCSTEYAPRPNRDPNPMCLMKTGSFRMGSTTGRENERPVHDVTLSAFYMDQFEVTNAQVVHYLNTVGSHKLCPSADNDLCVGIRPYMQWGEVTLDKDRARYVVVGNTHRYPFRGATRVGAQAYCAWAGKVLPTEAQWEYAARHDPKTGRDLAYPWGDRFRRKYAACGEKHCRDGFDETAPVGTFDGTRGYGNGSSPWGLYDMAGNIGEWVVDCYMGSYQPTIDACPGCPNPVARGAPDCQGTVRSGTEYGNPTTIRTSARFQISGENPNAGFRCVRSVSGPPATRPGTRRGHPPQ